MGKNLLSQYFLTKEMTEYIVLIRLKGQGNKLIFSFYKKNISPSELAK